MMPSTAEERYCLSLMFYGIQEDFPTSTIPVQLLGSDERLVSYLSKEKRCDTLCSGPRPVVMPPVKY